MIRLEEVNRIFQVGDQQVHALAAVNLGIGAGEYVSVMGPSGSGKSTLLNILGLLDHPTSGRYLLEGEDVTGLTDVQQAAVRRHKIGFVFQFFHLIARMTAAENIELPLMLEGIAPALRKTRVARMLDAVGLADRARHKPEQLSGGQRQRVAIARATILEPDMLLTDEPTGNLDRRSGHEIVEVLEALNSRGITLVMVTHDPELGARARRTLRMVDGRITADQTRDPAG
jgi:putative ABC transport system ATP-binding protein